MRNDPSIPLLASLLLFNHSNYRELGEEMKPREFWIDDFNGRCRLYPGPIEKELIHAREVVPKLDTELDILIKAVDTFLWCHSCRHSRIKVNIKAALQELLEAYEVYKKALRGEL